jgi:hypothetical protein
MRMWGWLVLTWCRSDTGEAEMKAEDLEQQLTTKYSSWLIDGKELSFSEKLGIGSSAKVYRGLYRCSKVFLVTNSIQRARSSY